MELFPEIENIPKKTTCQRYSCTMSQNEILDSIEELYLPHGIECDATYGNGCFYKNRPQPYFKFDIDPQIKGVVSACSTSLPVQDGSLGSIMFDPPFLTYIKQGRKHHNGGMIMSKRFGGYYRYEELEDHYVHSLSEFYRKLKPKGVLVFKCQDIIHNHKLHCTHFNVILWAVTEGFALQDLFVLGASRRMPRMNNGVQRHARINHSYFLVFRKV